VTATAIVNGTEVTLYQTDFETALDSGWSIVDGGTTTTPGTGPTRRTVTDRAR